MYKQYITPECFEAELHLQSIGEYWYKLYMETNLTSHYIHLQIIEVDNVSVATNLDFYLFTYDKRCY